MKFIKKNKKLLIIIGIALVFFIIIGILLFNLFYVSTKKNAYGNRLDGVENYLPTKEEKQKITSSLEETGFIDWVEIQENGKIINFIIDVKTGILREQSITLTSIIMANFKEEQINFFDFQVFLKDEEAPDEDKTYPIIGYRHKTSLEFVWSNN